VARPSHPVSRATVEPEEATVRVVEAMAFGGPETLRVVEVADPVAGPGEVLVRIRAATVNPTDLAARAGALRAMLPDIVPPFLLGWDLAGEVVAAGPDTGYREGDRVVGMIPWPHTKGRVAAYAELAAVDPSWLAPLPDGIGDDAASTLPLNGLTARQALDLLALAPGSTLLVTGASGGVGGFAVQLAVRDGHRVVAMAGRDDEDWVRGLGPAEVLARDADLATAGPVDAIFDAVPVGGEVEDAVRDGGAVVYTRPPRPAPATGDGRDVRRDVILVRPDPAALRRLAAGLAGGDLRTRVAEVLPLEGAARAHERAAGGGTHGKLVLAP
jgi:NADPH:quinone reductase-like Zn-dependent oxidoreductase